MNPAKLPVLLLVLNLSVATALSQRPAHAPLSEADKKIALTPPAPGSFEESVENDWVAYYVLANSMYMDGSRQDLEQRGHFELRLHKAAVARDPAKWRGVWPTAAGRRTSALIYCVSYVGKSVEACL